VVYANTFYKKPSPRAENALFFFQKPEAATPLMPYSTQLCSPAHPANQPEQPVRHCCRDAHQAADYILCATCYKREQPVVTEDDWDEEFPVRVKQQLSINHKISDDFEGPLWQ
jgi:hypothetical protein